MVAEYFPKAKKGSQKLANSDIHLIGYANAEQ